MLALIQWRLRAQFRPFKPFFSLPITYPFVQVPQMLWIGVRLHADRREVPTLNA